MLEKPSILMMVLLVASSLVGISSIHQYAEGQTPPPAATPEPQKAVVANGQVSRVTILADKTCNAFVTLPKDEPNGLGLSPGTRITLAAPVESCTLFGLSKIGKTQIVFGAQKSNVCDVCYRATYVSL
jgi:hypothetical protein